MAEEKGTAALVEEVWDREFLPYQQRVKENLARVDALIRTGTRLVVIDPLTGTPGLEDKRDSGAYDEVLRSAVVLLHATLDDVLRTVARRNLPLADAKVLEKIPLKGMNKGTFDLGQLAKHRGKTVDAVLQETIESYLDEKSYNNIPAVEALLESLKIKAAPYRQHFPALGAMMKRRHQIVHRADRRESSGMEVPPVDSIDIGTVTEWALAVSGFLRRLISTASGKQVVDKFREHGVNLE